MGQAFACNRFFFNAHGGVAGTAGTFWGRTRGEIALLLMIAALISDLSALMLTTGLDILILLLWNLQVIKKFNLEILAWLEMNAKLVSAGPVGVVD